MVILVWLEWISYDLETKTVEPNAHRVLEFLLILRTHGERACRLIGFLEHVHLTSCFNFDLSVEQGSVHR